jgi:protein-disulfide isomerase
MNKNNKIYIAGGVIAFLMLGLFTNGFGLITGKTIDSNELFVGNSPVLGNQNAPITIYIFSDFSCPFCSAAEGHNEQAMAALIKQDARWTPPVPGIIEKYVETGKAKLVFKYYPGHGSAKPAHLIALALDKQGLFWEFQDLAFKNGEDTSDIVKMKSLAKSIGADMDKLEEDLKSEDLEKQLKEDIAIGREAGIKGTPSFIINEELVVGAQPFYEFEKIIESKL